MSILLMILAKRRSKELEFGSLLAPTSFRLEWLSDHAFAATQRPGIYHSGVGWLREACFCSILKASIRLVVPRSENIPGKSLRRGISRSALAPPGAKASKSRSLGCR
jgi:hypothetical protein